LRFINPAIVTPQAYMLVDGVPAKHPRRTLTLVSSTHTISEQGKADVKIAKMLQNLANKPSYAKEQYMMSLNPFVENNKTRMNQFLNSLCEVGDFYESLEVCPSHLCEHGLMGSLISTWLYRRRIYRSISRLTSCIIPIRC
jgi:Ras GTPase-activating-like protein IQGAP2/3